MCCDDGESEKSLLSLEETIRKKDSVNSQNQLVLEVDLEVRHSDEINRYPDFCLGLVCFSWVLGFSGLFSLLF